MTPAIYGNAYDITQAPGVVAIRYEMIHETRIIPLDDSPRPNARPHMGVARGRWEGDTLVVESTNFRAPFRNGSPNLRLVERFKPVAKDKIEWSLTVIDPETWTKPWTYGMQLTQDPEQTLFEYATAGQKEQSRRGTARRAPTSSITPPNRRDLLRRKRPVGASSPP
jgi:hypothetical protein